MASNPNSFPDQPSERKVKDMVIEQVQEVQRENPEYIANLARRAWDHLSPAEQDFYRTAVAKFFPDIEDREQASRFALLIEHIDLEAEVAIKLNGAFNLPEKPHPIDGQDLAA